MYIVSTCMYTVHIQYMYMCFFDIQCSKIFSLCHFQTISCPCSSTSLGKFEVEYTPSPTKNTKIVGHSGNKHTLTIPESKLVWHGGHRGTGSLMLVFQARPSTGKTSQKKQLAQSLAKVSVELNRINHSDILQLRQANQSLTPTTPSCTSSNACGSRATKHQHKARESAHQSSNVSREGSVDVNECLGQYPNGTGTVNYSKASRKTRSRVKDSHDACMDTGVATRDTSACNGPSEHARDSVTSSFPKKGFTENGTSLLSKLATQQNGISRLNGFRDSHTSSKVHCCDDPDSAFLDCHETNSCSLTVSIPCTTYSDGPAASPSHGSLCSSQQSLPKRQRYKVPDHQRSELQFILSREKTPERGLGIREPSVSTAGELSTQCDTHQPKSSQNWVDNETRRITSVEPNNVTVSTSGVKRSFSESDAHPLSSDIGSPPPAKMARFADEDSLEGCVKDEIEEMKYVTGAFEKHDKTNADLSSSVSPPSSPAPSPAPSSEERATAATQPARNPAEPASGTAAAPEGLFCAEMVVFDSRGECLLDKGEYTILMQRCQQKESSGSDQPPPLVTFAPLSWSSVFGGEDQVRIYASWDYYNSGQENDYWGVLTDTHW